MNFTQMRPNLQTLQVPNLATAGIQGIGAAPAAAAAVPALSTGAVQTVIGPNGQIFNIQPVAGASGIQQVAQVRQIENYWETGG